MWPRRRSSFPVVPGMGIALGISFIGGGLIWHFTHLHLAVFVGWLAAGLVIGVTMTRLDDREMARWRQSLRDHKQRLAAEYARRRTAGEKKT